MAAAAETLGGIRPSIYHNDHSMPEKPVIRSLEEEIARVVRGRVVNPKWIDGVMRHGYKERVQRSPPRSIISSPSRRPRARSATIISRRSIRHSSWIRRCAFALGKNPAAYEEMKELAAGGDRAAALDAAQQFRAVRSYRDRQHDRSSGGDAAGRLKLASGE